MRRIKWLIIGISIFLLPTLVKAEECDSDLIIDSIKLQDKSKDVEETSKATFEGNKIHFDLKMYKVGDYAEYKIKVKNVSQEDYYFDDQSLKLDTEYMKYEVFYEDDSNIVKKGKNKNITLQVIYQTEVEKEKFRSGRYEDNSSDKINV